MRPNLIVKILLPFILATDSEQPRNIWSDKLPNEKLEGVPPIIVDNEKKWTVLKETMMNTFGRINTDNVNQEAMKQQKSQKYFDDSVPFFCNVSNTRSKERPTSAHALRPGDVDIIAALGDSLTAANGALAMNILYVFVENRGVCGIIGGQGNWRKFLTLPNILKEFNPKLIGYATADASTHNRNSQFNVAEPGAMIQDLPFMVKQLVKRIAKDSRIDFVKDWKLVNVFIGGNNICQDYCYSRNLSETVEEYRRILTYVFTFLRDNMPRTIVNFLHTLNVGSLSFCKGTPPMCDLFHEFLCPCLFGPEFQSKHQEFLETTREWQRVDEEVASDKRFRTKEDFAIVLQNFTKKMSLPLKTDSFGRVTCDWSYLSADCFHFSQKGHARLANALWNNMLQSEGLKSSNWPTEFQTFLCPSEQFPYIYTWKNSKL